LDTRLPLARQLIEAGTLPASDNVKTYGGRSSGTACRLCGKPIAEGAPEIELVEQDPPGNSALLHPDCYASWLAAAQSPAT